MWFLTLLQENMKMKGPFFYLSFIVLYWLQDVHQEWLQDPKVSHMIQQLKHHSLASTGYSWNNEELFYKGHLYLSKQMKLKSMVIFELHASPTTGNSWFTKTYERVNHSFVWDNMNTPTTPKSTCN